MLNWLFFYVEGNNYDDADLLNKSLKKAAGKYHIKINDPEWVEMPKEARAKDWIEEANKYFGKGKREFAFVLFLLGKNSYIYPELKFHSLCSNG